MVSEGDDPKAAFTASNIWSDIAKVEVIPVTEGELAMKLVSKK